MKMNSDAVPLTRDRKAGFGPPWYYYALLFLERFPTPSSAIGAD